MKLSRVAISASWQHKSQVNSQVIKCRNYVPHQSHEKKWHLKHIFFHEIDAVAECSVPRRRVQGDQP